MQRPKIIPLTLLALLLMTISAQAFNPPADQSFKGEPHMAKLQKQLDLSDEQTTSIKKIFASDRQEKEAILKKYNLKPGDLKTMRRQIRSANKEGFKTLRKLLTKTQMQQLQEKVIQETPFQFAQMPKEQQLSQLQNKLQIDRDLAQKVAQIIETGHKKHQEVLKKNQFIPEQIHAFRRDLAEQRAEMKQKISTILNAEQMAKFEKMGQQHKHNSLLNRGQRT